jgi:hypothetical protein
MDSPPADGRVRGDVAKCPGQNHVGLDCPMRLACDRFTRKDALHQNWLSVGPFGGEVRGTRVEFWCDFYENNGRDINEATNTALEKARA